MHVGVDSGPLARNPCFLFSVIVEHATMECGAAFVVFFMTGIQRHQRTPDDRGRPGLAVSRRCRLEDDDQIANVGDRQPSALGEQVERGALRARRWKRFRRFAQASCCHEATGYFADYLSEAARGGKVLVQAAIGDEKGLPARNPAVDDICDEMAASPRLDNEFRLRKVGFGALGQ